MAIGSQRSRTALLSAWFVSSGVAGAVLLSGCAGAPGSVPGTVSTVLKDSSSAVATARLALGLDADGKLTMVATATTLEDSLKETGLSGPRRTGTFTGCPLDRADPSPAFLP